ncbi:succinate dehydrogenase, cytochrome b556 subunit [Thiosulfatimonas sediminis]|nr:succinate dehydrogenase, cytochrome b556 subunit [Thiosulfatimonas sediminis]
MYQSSDHRPKNLNLLAFNFPLNAIFSILHRISGVALIISLFGYLAVANLIWLHAEVRLSLINDHWILLCLHSLFWLAVIFHWLTGARHLLAENVFNTVWYSRLASNTSNYLILVLWLVASAFALNRIWTLS